MGEPWHAAEAAATGGCPLRGGRADACDSVTANRVTAAARRMISTGPLVILFALAAACGEAASLGVSPAAIHTELPFGGARDVSLIVTNPSDQPMTVALEFEGKELTAAVPLPFNVSGGERTQVLVTLATDRRTEANLTGSLRVVARGEGIVAPALMIPVAAAVRPPRTNVSLSFADVYPAEVGSPLVVEAGLANSGTRDVAVRLRLRIGEVLLEGHDLPLRAGRPWAGRVLLAHAFGPGAYEAMMLAMADGREWDARPVSFIVHPGGTQNRSLRPGGLVLERTDEGLKVSILAANPTPWTTVARLEGALLEDGIPAAEAASPNATLPPFGNATLSARFPGRLHGPFLLTGALVADRQRWAAQAVPVTIDEPVQPWLLLAAGAGGLAAGFVAAWWRRRAMTRPPPVPGPSPPTDGREEPWQL